MLFQTGNSLAAANLRTSGLQPTIRLNVGSTGELWDGILLAHKLGRGLLIGREPKSSDYVHGTLVGSWSQDTISRQQGVFQWNNKEGLTYTDLGLNVSLLNSVPLSKPRNSDSTHTALFSGDTLSIAGKIEIKIPDMVQAAAALLSRLNQDPITGIEDFERIAHGVSFLQRGQESSISGRALALIADAAIAWAHSPRTPEQLAYLAKLAMSPGTKRLESLLRSRRFPLDNGNSIADTLLCLPAKLSGERIFKEERGEVLDVIAVAPPNNSGALPSLHQTTSSAGQFRFIGSSITRFKDALGTRHIITQGSITSCVRAVSLLLAMDAAVKANEPYTICAGLERGTRNAGLSDHDGAFSQLKRELANSRLVPILTELNAPPSPKELQKTLKNGPAMIAISTSVGGHVIIVDEVKTPLIGKAVVTIRDTYHGWCIKIPWDTLAPLWQKTPKLLQVVPSSARV